MKLIDVSKKFWQWVILLFLAFIWGSSFILMKKGMNVYSWDEVAALRILFASLVLFPVFLKFFKADMKKNWKLFFVVGMIGNFIPAFLFTKAETGISSALAGMLNSLTPLFTLLLGVSFFKMKTKPINVFGVITGFGGAIGLLLVGQEIGNSVNLLFGGMVVIATLFYGMSVNIMKRYLTGINPAAVTAWCFTLCAPWALIYLFQTEVVAKTNSPEAALSLFYIALLGIIGTALAVIIFYVLIQHTTALLASSVTYLIPIVAMFWGIADGEQVSFLHFMWIALILCGIYLVNKK